VHVPQLDVSVPKHGLVSVKDSICVSVGINTYVPASEQVIKLPTGSTHPDFDTVVPTSPLVQCTSEKLADVTDSALPNLITIQNLEWEAEIAHCVIAKEAKAGKGKGQAHTPSDVPRRSLRSNKGAQNLSQ